MFGIKKKGAEIKQPVYVVLVPEVAAYGGKWVKAGSVRVTRHVLGVR